MTSVNIRHINIEDIPRVLGLGVLMHEEGGFGLLPFSEQKVASTLAACVSLAGHLCLVAEVEGKIVGLFIAAVTSPWFSEALITKDKVLYVLPSYRRHNLAQKLVQQYLVWAKEYGVKEAMAAQSTGINIEGIKCLYESEGFSTVGHVFRKRI